MYIDTHSHLSDSRFDIDRDLAIKRAIESNVESIIEIACEPSLWKPSYEISVLNPKIYCAYGLHPHEAKHFTEETFLILKKLLEDKKALAVGETGLDYFYDYSPKETQITVFKIHIKLARQLNKPLIVHCRQAYDDLKEILHEESGNKKYNGVIHCFSGNADEAREMISMGFYIGIDGPVTYPKATLLKSVVKDIPLENMLLETDSPYLAPQEFRGKRNEPAYINKIAQEIAAIKNISVNQVAKTTSENAKLLFKIF